MKPLPYNPLTKRIPSISSIPKEDKDILFADGGSEPNVNVKPVIPHLRKIWNAVKPSFSGKIYDRVNGKDVGDNHKHITGKVLQDSLKTAKSTLKRLKGANRLKAGQAEALGRLIADTEQLLDDIYNHDGEMLRQIVGTDKESQDAYTDTLAALKKALGDVVIESPSEKVDDYDPIWDIDRLYDDEGTSLTDRDISGLSHAPYHPMKVPPNTSLKKKTPSSLYCGDPNNDSHTTWYDSGNMRERLEEGVHTWWYENGQKHKKVPVLNGSWHGEFCEWDREGRVVCIVPYEYNERHGTEEKWDYTGRGVEYDKYKIRSVEWNEGIRSEIETEIEYLEGADGYDDFGYFFQYKASESRYKNGKLHGPYRAFYRNDAVRSECFYENGLKTGDETFFYITRNYKSKHQPKKSKCSYRKGLLDGPFIKWDSSGRLLYSASYKDDKKIGLEQEWSSSGMRLREACFEDGLKNGIEREWTNEGQKVLEALFKDGKLNGVSTWWHNYGPKKEVINYKNGQRHGMSTWWNLDGKKICETNYEDGYQHGLTTNWDSEDHKICEVSYVRGLKSGEFVYYHVNGEIRVKGLYKISECQDRLNRVELDRGDFKIIMYLDKWNYEYLLDDEESREEVEQEYFDLFCDENFEVKSKIRSKQKNFHSKVKGEYSGKLPRETPSIYNASFFDGLVYGGNERGYKTFETSYREGIKHGEDVRWYAYGEKKSESSYNNGKKDGIDQSWHENGNKKCETSYRKGLKHGHEVKWYKNGQKMSEGYYKTGEEIDQYSQWDEKLLGVFNCSFGDNVKAEWHKNGQKKRELKLLSKDNHYSETKWFENGNKRSEVLFKDGEINGLQVEWHDNGQKEWARNFDMGIQHGMETSWYKSGQKEWVCYYDMGKQHGAETRWSNGGVKQSESYWEGGYKIR